MLATVALGMILVAVPVWAQDAGSGAELAVGDNMNMEILLQKVKADKKLLVAGNMDLTDAEGKKFWPIYDVYQKELIVLSQRLGRLVESYAESFNAGKGMVSNDTAKKLLNEALSIEEVEVKLKRSYAEKIGKVLPATKTARYMQIENKIRAATKAEMAQQIPLIY